MISAEAFGAHLKKLRQLRQLSRREVAGQLGISESAYASWEQGRRDPGIADLPENIGFQGGFLFEKGEEGVPSGMTFRGTSKVLQNPLS